MSISLQGKPPQNYSALKQVQKLFHKEQSTPSQNQQQTIRCSEFCHFKDSTLLSIGYQDGFQLWDVSDTKEIKEIVHVQHSTQDSHHIHVSGFPLSVESVS